MTEQLDRLWAPWRLEYIETAVDSSGDCFLCEALSAGKDRERLLVSRGELAFVLMNRYPYNNGHLLVAPNQHLGELDELAPEELCALFELTRKAVGWIEEAYHPHGFNIGINLGRIAGAGLPGHLHVHIVPRWDGDTNFMPVLGGVKVISEGLASSFDKLREVIQKENRHDAG